MINKEVIKMLELRKVTIEWQNSCVPDPPHCSPEEGCDPDVPCSPDEKCNPTEGWPCNPDKCNPDE